MTLMSKQCVAAYDVDVDDDDCVYVEERGSWKNIIMKFYWLKLLDIT